MPKDFKQVLVSQEVAEALQNRGRAGESYDKVLRRLLHLPERERKNGKAEDKNNPDNRN